MTHSLYSEKKMIFSHSKDRGLKVGRMYGGGNGGTSDSGVVGKVEMGERRGGRGGRGGGRRRRA
jgi:hypothetical protein